MTKLNSAFPLGLFVNEGNALDVQKLRGKIDFLLVKVNGVVDWDAKFAEHVNTAYQLDIPCGLVIYIDPSTVDFNWPLNDFSRWNKEAVVGKYLGLNMTKRFNFGVLYYHPGRMVGSDGKAIEPQWLTKIPIFMAEQLHAAWFGSVNNVPAVQRKILIGCSEAALALVADPATSWRDWPFMSVVDGLTSAVTWDTVREAMNSVDKPAVTPVDCRPLWNFDPYPSHNLDGAGGAGLVAYLGTNANMLRWCAYEPTGNTGGGGDPTGDPTGDDDGDGGDGGSGGSGGVVTADLSGLTAAVNRMAAALEKMASKEYK